MEKRICIECDLDLTKEQKTQIEELPKLGLQDTRKVNLKAKKERVIKNEGRLAKRSIKFHRHNNYYFQCRNFETFADNYCGPPAQKRSSLWTT